MRTGARRPSFGVLAAAGAVSLVLALAACSDSDDDDASAASTTTEAEQPDDDTTATTADEGTVTQTSDPPRTEGFVGARVDVTGLACEGGDDGWTVSGTVTNPTEAAVDYRIFTSFLDDAQATAGLLQTDVTGVPAGGAQEWSGELPVTGSDLQCVLRVERTEAGAP